MIEYVVMDYDGEPVTIKNGEICDAESSYYDHGKGRTVTQIWNADALDWEDDDDNDEPCGNDRELYGLGWVRLQHRLAQLVTIKDTSSVHRASFLLNQ